MTIERIPITSREQRKITMTAAMVRALMKAASRERKNICPIPGVHSNAEQMLIEAMDRRGFIAWDYPEGRRMSTGAGEWIMKGAPRISEAGLKAIGK